MRSKTHCFFCKAKLSRVRGDIDHLIPRSKGGFTTLDNGQFVCSVCNHAKGSSTPSEYFRSIGKRGSRCIYYTGSGRDGRCRKAVAFGTGEYCKIHKIAISKEKKKKQTHVPMKKKKKKKQTHVPMLLQLLLKALDKH